MKALIIKRTKSGNVYVNKWKKKVMDEWMMLSVSVLECQFMRKLLRNADGEWAEGVGEECRKEHIICWVPCCVSGFYVSSIYSSRFYCCSTNTNTLWQCIEGMENVAELRICDEHWRIRKWKYIDCSTSAFPPDATAFSGLAFAPFQHHFFVSSSRNILSKLYLYD